MLIPVAFTIAVLLEPFPQKIAAAAKNEKTSGHGEDDEADEQIVDDTENTEAAVRGRAGRGVVDNRCWGGLDLSGGLVLVDLGWRSCLWTYG